MTDPISAEHIRRNLESRDRWQEFAPHRQIVTEQLTRLATEPGRLCLLGAGNCNDVDLAALTSAYREVHLVDLDADSLRWGVQRQRSADFSRVVLHGGIEISGIVGELARWSGARDLATIGELARLAATCPALRLPGPFDVVASVGLLSQLIDSVAMAAPHDDSRFMDLLLAVRNRHLRVLVELCAPLGWGLLVTDFVSSQTCPELTSFAEEDLPARLSGLISEHNFFHGLNPFVLRAMYQSDPQLAPLVDHVQLQRPWRWNLGPRTYAVCAVRFRRKPLEPG